MAVVFSESQRLAITCPDEPTLVLAGPGSGKTAVITARIKYLIEERNVRPDQILVITFTKAAATEMKLRFQALMDGRRLPVNFGTFHAVFFSILKNAYHYRADQIIRADVKYQYMREILSRHGLLEGDEHELIENLLNEISSVKNHQVPLEHYYASCIGSGKFREIYQAYEQKLRANHLIDFDDMLIDTKHLLEERNDYLRAWQQKFAYILVDEVQDMNQLQYQITQMLAAPSNCLFFVGDDDQSIYRFRGAKPELMKQFLQDYPNAKTMQLKENYRCGERIVRAAGCVIAHNENRFTKEIHAARSQMGNVHLECFANITKEQSYLMDEIQKLHDNGKAYSDIAVLYRTNRQSGYLLEQMMERGIPFCTKERVPIIYDHWIAKDIMAYLMLGAGKRDRSLVLAIMNRPLRYLSRDSLTDRLVDFDEWEKLFDEQDWIARRIAQLSEDIRMISKLSPYAAINYIRKGIGYEAFTAEYAREHGAKPEDLSEVLDELQQSAVGYDSVEQWQVHIAEYRRQMEEEYLKREQQQEGVRILSLHSAKGLEFDTVFLPQLYEGSLPYKKAVLPADIEEERRLFYVGMTRAKNELYLLTCLNVRNKNVQASRFLDELTE